MNTPAHLIFGAAAFARPYNPRVTWAALAGALLPDLSLYVMVGVSLFALRIPPQVVFDELYFSDAWQTVFAVDNSFLLWGVALGVAVWRGSDWAVALTGAALLHLAFDFPLHHDDGRPHFWPLSDWVFESPISYWDPRAHGGIVAPLEIGVCLALCWLLWRRFDSARARAAIAFGALVQLAPVFLWAWVFALGQSGV